MKEKESKEGGQVSLLHFYSHILSFSLSAVLPVAAQCDAVRCQDAGRIQHRARENRRHTNWANICLTSSRLNFGSSAPASVPRPDADLRFECRCSCDEYAGDDDTCC